MANKRTVERTTLAELTPDSNNANKGTERGRKLLESSLRQYLQTNRLRLMFTTGEHSNAGKFPRIACHQEARSGIRP